MGRQRRQQPSRASSVKDYTPREIAAASAIATLFSGGTTTATVSSIASILLPLVPKRLIGNPGLAANVVELVARQTVEDSPDASRIAVAGPLERVAQTERLLYRGFYAVAALRRIATAALEGREELIAAARRERGYFRGHVEQSNRRVVASRQVDSARELYGVVVGWYHLNPTLDPRPDHVEAGSKNFRADLFLPPVTTGVWPGVLNHCGCVAGPPHQDAELMVSA